jgi:hypothetical protein
MMQLGGRSSFVALFALVFVVGAAACGSSGGHATQRSTTSLDSPTTGITIDDETTIPDDSIDDETTIPEDSNDDETTIPEDSTNDDTPTIPSGSQLDPEAVRQLFDPLITDLQGLALYSNVDASAGFAWGLAAQNLSKGAQDLHAASLDDASEIAVTTSAILGSVASCIEAEAGSGTGGDDEFPILQPVALVCPQAGQISLETEALQEAEQNALAGR